MVSSNEPDKDCCLSWVSGGLDPVRNEPFRSIESFWIVQYQSEKSITPAHEAMVMWTRPFHTKQRKHIKELESNHTIANGRLWICLHASLHSTTDTIRTRAGAVRAAKRDSGGIPIRILFLFLQRRDFQLSTSAPMTVRSQGGQTQVVRSDPSLVVLSWSSAGVIHRNRRFIASPRIGVTLMCSLFCLGRWRLWQRVIVSEPMAPPSADGTQCQEMGLQVYAQLESDVLRYNKTIHISTDRRQPQNRLCGYIFSERGYSKA